MHIQTQTDPTDGTLTTYTHGAHTMRIVTKTDGTHQFYSVESDHMETDVRLTSNYRVWGSSSARRESGTIKISVSVSGHDYRISDLAAHLTDARDAVTAFAAVAATHGLTVTQA